MNVMVYFNDYYNRRASSGEIEACMNPTSSSTQSKSQSLDQLNATYNDNPPSMEFLEFSKTANFRSRRDAVFEPIGTASKTHLVISSGASHLTTLTDATNEFGRVTVTTTSALIENAKKRKTNGGIEVEMKKLKSG